MLHLLPRSALIIQLRAAFCKTYSAGAGGATAAIAGAETGAAAGGGVTGGLITEFITAFDPLIVAPST